MGKDKNKLPKTDCINAKIFIYSDNDVDIYSPAGLFTAYGPSLDITLTAENAEKLRRKILDFLLEIRVTLPGKEYDEYYSRDHDSNVKLHIYEAILVYSKPGLVNFHRGGNQEVDISIW